MMSSDLGQVITIVTIPIRNQLFVAGSGETYGGLYRGEKDLKIDNV